MRLRADVMASRSEGVTLSHWYRAGSVAGRRRWPGVSAGLSLWGRLPVARDHARAGHADQGSHRHEDRLPGSRLPPSPIVEFAASASGSLPPVASRAIGFAEPRPGVHSPGFGACGEDGGEMRTETLTWVTVA